ncbi:MAG: hypothetical protein V3R87_10335 [Dehalococcoidia bacterium]
MGTAGWYVFAIVMFATVLMIMDAVVGYKKAKADDIFGLAQKSAEMKGLSGYRRSIIALTIVLILAISIFHLLVNATDENSTDIVGNILSILAGLTAALAGFYFGGRFTERRAEAAEDGVKRAGDIEERVRSLLDLRLGEILLELEKLKMDRPGASKTSEGETGDSSP